MSTDLKLGLCAVVFSYVVIGIFAVQVVLY